MSAPVRGTLQDEARRHSHRLPYRLLPARGLDPRAAEADPLQADALLLHVAPQRSATALASLAATPTSTSALTAHLPASAVGAEGASKSSTTTATKETH